MVKVSGSVAFGLSFREITLWPYVPHKPNKPRGYNDV
jgi:hypothetical protein